jgi:UDP-N-acetylglucosamine 2-epimerase (non-hydrolysing)
MPEEINRVVADALADLLFTTSPEARDNLTREGVDPARVHFVGNPMIDTLLRFRSRFDPEPLRARFSLPAEYGVVTIHRPANVDTPQAAARVTNALIEVSRLVPLMVPLHPRGREALVAAGLAAAPGIQVVEPLGYIDFVSLVAGARLVITDSGGIQEETTILGVPCFTLRPNTERPITITNGTNRLAEAEELAGAVETALRTTSSVDREPPPLWDGKAGRRIAQVIVERFSD